jgi:hypothetical protein
MVSVSLLLSSQFSFHFIPELQYIRTSNGEWIEILEDCNHGIY